MKMVRELRALYSNMVPLNSVEWGEGVAMPRSLCPCMVAFYDAFTDPSEGTISIIVEYMDGGSLQVMMG